MKISATEFVHHLLWTAQTADPDASVCARFWTVECVITNMSSAFPREELYRALAAEKTHTLRAVRERMGG